MKIGPYFCSIDRSDSIHVDVDFRDASVLFQIDATDYEANVRLTIDEAKEFIESCFEKILMASVEHKCKNCKYFDQGPLKVAGACRRYPPSVQANPDEPHYFVYTVDDSWCGEFKPLSGSWGLR